MAREVIRSRSRRQSAPSRAPATHRRHSSSPLARIVSPPATRIGSRFTLIALAIVVALVLTGLVAADRMVERANAAQAELDARESAALVERFLAVHAEALVAFHGVRVGRDERVPERMRFDALVGSLREHLSGFRRIWMTDSAGVVLFEMAFGDVEAPLPAGLDVDT